jgi:hypothetical protein
LTAIIGMVIFGNPTAGQSIATLTRRAGAAPPDQAKAWA